MNKMEVPNFRKEKENKNSKKMIIVVSVILIVLLVSLVYFFAHKYLLTKKQIGEIFENMKEVEPDTEFDPGSFSDLKNACVGKEIGDSCSCEFNGEPKKGVCGLSENNESVCIS